MPSGNILGFPISFGMFLWGFLGWCYGVFRGSARDHWSLGPCPARRRRVAGVDALGALPRVAQLGVDLQNQIMEMKGKATFMTS